MKEQAEEIPDSMLAAAGLPATRMSQLDPAADSEKGRSARCLTWMGPVAVPSFFIRAAYAYDRL